MRGHYWATVGVGLYAEGLGILSALAKGVEGKYKAHANRAIALDRDYLEGGPTMLLGRLYTKLPWPKRDLEKSLELLRDTVARHPKNLLARLFLADALWADGKRDEARTLAAAVAESPPGKDQPGDRRTLDLARRWLQRHP